MQKCPECGYENEDKSLSCNLCGHVLRKEKPTKIELSWNSTKWFETRLFIPIIVFFALAILTVSWMMNTNFDIFTRNVGVSKPKKTPSDLSLINGSDTGRRTVIGGISGNTRIEYYYLVPQSVRRNAEPAGLLIVVPDINATGGNQVTGLWADFAEKHGSVILSPSFSCVMDDYYAGESYQFPAKWSGRTMLKMITDLNAVHTIKKTGFLMAGWSHGAQFVSRFIFLYPDLCSAAALHAPVGLPEVTSKIYARIHISAGNDDETSKNGAIYFDSQLRSCGIISTLKLYNGLGHMMQDEQTSDILAFFGNI